MPNTQDCKADSLANTPDTSQEMPQNYLSRRILLLAEADNDPDFCQCIQ